MKDNLSYCQHLSYVRHLSRLYPSHLFMFLGHNVGNTNVFADNKYCLTYTTGQTPETLTLFNDLRRSL